MADFNSSLPVRTQNNGDVVVEIVDGTTPTQKLAIDASGRITDKLNDGSGNPITSQANGAQRALDVGIDVAGVQIDPRQIRTLTSADTVTVDQGTSPWVTSDLADGSVTGGTAGTKSLLGGGQFNTTSPTLTNGQQAALQMDASGNLKVTTVSTVPGTPIQNYQTSAALAAGSSVTLTYTVVASHTFSFERMFVSASGKIKAVVQNNGSTIFTAFSSTALPNIDITITAPPTIAAGNTASVIITNEDTSAFDVYATFEGNQN